MSEERPRRGRPPSAQGPLPIALTIRGRAEWREWLDARAEEAGGSTADLIDKALAAFAKAKKWGEVPSRT